MRALCVVLPLVVGCGSAAEPLRAASTPASEADPKPAEATRGPVESLERADVIATVDAGLGSFLQRVEVEPALRNGQFTGFRIVELYPPEYWRGVDLRPGDVVTQVNGLPIERETQAYAAFESLRSATELRVSLERNGEPRELVLPILENGKPPAGAPAKKDAPEQPSSDAAG